MNWMVLLVVALLSAGCIEESSLPFLSEKTTTTTSTKATTTSTTTSSTTSTTLEPVIELMVHIQDFQAKPATATISRYNGVTWRNLDPVNHNIAFDDASSGPIKPGATYTRIFNETGTYRYYCSIHKRYMEGVITVT